MNWGGGSNTNLPGKSNLVLTHDCIQAGPITPSSDGR